MQEEVFERLPGRWLFLLTFHWLVYLREVEANVRYHITVRHISFDICVLSYL